MLLHAKGIKMFFQEVKIISTTGELVAGNYVDDALMLDEEGNVLTPENGNANFEFNCGLEKEPQSKQTPQKMIKFK